MVDRAEDVQRGPGVEGVDEDRPPHVHERALRRRGDQALLADAVARRRDPERDRPVGTYSVLQLRDEARVEPGDRDGAAAGQPDLERDSSAMPYSRSRAGPPASTSCASPSTEGSTQPPVTEPAISPRSFSASDARGVARGRAAPLDHRRDRGTPVESVERRSRILHASDSEPAEAGRSPCNRGKGLQVDKDRIEGRRKAPGKVTGDEKLGEGEAQGAWGKAKDSADDAWDKTKDAADDVKDAVDKRTSPRPERMGRARAAV